MLHQDVICTSNHSLPWCRDLSIFIQEGLVIRTQSPMNAGSCSPEAADARGARQLVA